VTTDSAMADGTVIDGTMSDGTLIDGTVTVEARIEHSTGASPNWNLYSVHLSGTALSFAYRELS
jgi:hypothetical protein